MIHTNGSQFGFCLISVHTCDQLIVFVAPCQDTLLCLCVYSKREGGGSEKERETGRSCQRAREGETKIARASETEYGNRQAISASKSERYGAREGD